MPHFDECFGRQDLDPILELAAGLRLSTPLREGHGKLRTRRNPKMAAKTVVVVAVLAAAIGAPIAGLMSAIGGRPLTSTSELKSLDQADEWLNSSPLTPEALRGKVVLINFWTYSCINWRRQLPYVRAWAEKYKKQGLVVVGVHAPEFEFERNIANIKWAVKDMEIDYPVAVDNGHVIWRALGNRAWPALYFVDAQGHVRHHHFGEGEYERSEKLIQELLREAGATGVSSQSASDHAAGCLDGTRSLQP